MKKGLRQRRKIDRFPEIRNPQDVSRSRAIFNYLPYALLVEDCSSVARLQAKLQEKSIQDIRGYLFRRPDLVIKAFKEIKILKANRAAMLLYNVSNKEELSRHFQKTLTRRIASGLVHEFLALIKKEKEFEADFRFKTPQGRQLDIFLRFSVPPGYEQSLKLVLVSLQDVTHRKKWERHLKKMARIDGLTGLLNHKAIAQRLEEELSRARRHHLDFSCLMVDMDHFKVINDRLGHQKGDQVIKQAAVIIKGALRKSDVVGRYGGDEFLVILPQTNSQSAVVAAGRVQKLFAEYMVKYEKICSIKNTLSIGISGFPANRVLTHRDLILAADRAMYQSKISGGNQIILTPEKQG